MSTTHLTFRQRPLVAAIAAILIGLVLAVPADARPGGGGGGGRGGGGGFGGGGGGFGGGHGGGSFGGNFGGASISRPSNIGGGGSIGSRPRPEHPIVKPPGNRPDRPNRPNRPDGPNRPNVPWVPGAGVWWGASIADEYWDDVVYTLPNNCQQVRVNNQRYVRCGNNWYQKVYAGNQVAYAGVRSPR